MDEMFRKYCKYLEGDRKDQNIFAEIESKYKNKEIDFYDFLEKNHFYNKILFQFSEKLKKSGISNIEINENNVIFTTKSNGLKLICNGKDRRAAPFELLNFGECEKQEIELVYRLSSGKGLQIDVGANLGWFSLLMAKRFPEAKILAFEPMEDNFSLLNANLVLNGINNVQAYNLAVTEKNRSVRFHFSPESSVLASEKNIINYRNTKEISVNGIALDQFLSEKALQNVELLKYDIEGGEFNAILGSWNIIQKSKPIIVSELFHEWTKKFDYHPSEVIKSLKELNYEVFLPLQEGLEKVEDYQPNSFKRQNYFFLHKEKHNELISRFSFRD